MAVLELVSVPTFSQQRSNLVQPSNLEAEAGRVAKKTQYGDRHALRELGFAGLAPLAQFARALPNPKKPFAAENLEHIKLLKNGDDNEAYNSADRMIAALVSIATHNAGLKTEPIDFLKGIVRLRQSEDLSDPYLVGTRLDQLKSENPGSKRANGPYDQSDRQEVSRLAPVLTLAAIDAFTEGDSFFNREHENPQQFTINSNDLSQILKNIFLITKKSLN